MRFYSCLTEQTRECMQGSSRPWIELMHQANINQTQTIMWFQVLEILSTVCQSKQSEEGGWFHKLLTPRVDIGPWLAIPWSLYPWECIVDISSSIQHLPSCHVFLPGNDICVPAGREEEEEERLACCPFTASRLHFLCNVNIPQQNFDMLDWTELYTCLNCGYCQS